MNMMNSLSTRESEILIIAGIKRSGDEKPLLEAMLFGARRELTGFTPVTGDLSIVRIFLDTFGTNRRY
jgi:hypothetical protein